MKQWIIKLLSDTKKLPSTRLHLAWGCFFLLFFYVIYNTIISQQMQVEVVWALISGSGLMSGISAFEKGGKDEKNNIGRPQGEN